MPSRDHHPAANVLSDYALGRLPESALADVAEHVEHCPACQETLGRSELPTDPLIDELDGLAQDDASWPFDREAELAQVQANVEQFVPSEAEAESGDSAGESPQSQATSLEEPPLAPIRDYLLLAPLGRGGMGVVYRARHTKLDRLVAIKVLPVERMRHPEAVARFEREMQAVGKLDHPNIVRAHDAGEADGKHYLVMELIDGVDLGKLAEATGSMQVADACELVRQAAVGLDYAHRHGMIHRDVKPANLMLTRDGIVKVMDLGLARWAECLPTDRGEFPIQSVASSGVELTGVSNALGTPDYMAPEQYADSHAADRRTDVYGLGATLYRLLAGRPPYAPPRYDTVAKKLAGLAHDAPPSIAELRPDLPPGLVTLVMRMLAREPRDRPPTLGHLATALAGHCAGHHVAALAGGSVEWPARRSDVAEAEIVAAPRSTGLPPILVAIAGVSVLLLAITALVPVLIRQHLKNLNLRPQGPAVTATQPAPPRRSAPPASRVLAPTVRRPPPPGPPPKPGTWEILLPAGFRRPVQMMSLGNETFLLRRTSILDGVYRWDGREFVVQKPDDSRYVGLIWNWDGDDLVLVDEPASHPAGPSYVGTRLKFVDDEPMPPAGRESQAAPSSR